MWLLNQPLVSLVDCQVLRLLWKFVWTFKSTEVVSWMSAESRQQTATPETASETCVASFHSFSEECYPFWLLGLFFFSFIFTLAFTLSSKVTSRKLPPWASDLYPYRLLPVSKSAFTLCSQYQFFMHLFSLQPSSYKKIASCFASFNKPWELSTAAWRSLISCGSLPFSWLS